MITTQGQKNDEGKTNIKISDKTSDQSSQSALEARQIADELKNDTYSCKFCHAIPPRKKAKYP